MGEPLVLPSAHRPGIPCRSQVRVVRGPHPGHHIVIDASPLEAEGEAFDLGDRLADSQALGS